MPQELRTSPELHIPTNTSSACGPTGSVRPPNAPPITQRVEKRQFGRRPKHLGYLRKCTSPKALLPPATPQDPSGAQTSSVEAGRRNNVILGDVQRTEDISRIGHSVKLPYHPGPQRTREALYNPFEDRGPKNVILEDVPRIGDISQTASDHRHL